ncbi:MAG TPA: hypothetical protein VF027_03560 [Sphingomicrobium sp.]
MWPTLPGTIAGGAACGAAAAGAAAVAFWVGGLAGVCAAAGVSPAAAKAIAHPINLIFTPVTSLGLAARGPAPPVDFAASIGAAFGSLKRLFGPTVEGPWPAA